MTIALSSPAPDEPRRLPAITPANAVRAIDSIVDECTGQVGLTIDVAARILGCTTRHVRRLCEGGQLVAFQVDGPRGRQWLVDPACRSELRLAAGLGATTGPVTSGLSYLPARHRERLTERRAMLESYLDSLEHEKPLGMAEGHWQARWCAGWNLDHPDRPVSGRTLQRMLNAYRGGGIAGLVDRRHANRSGGLLSPAAQAYVLGLYAGQNRPTVPSVYRLLLAAAADQGWEVPSLRAVQAWLSRQDPKLIAAGRDPKKFRDRCVPHIERDASQIAAMELVVGDHHQFDVMWPRLAWDPARKQVRWRWYRPWLSAWLDFRSWMPFATAIAFDSPDADRVMGSFMLGVLAHGCPQHVYLDNGKDYRATRFAGGRTRRAKLGEPIVDRKALTPILTGLGIEVTWALPYNAKAKVIEPWFGVVEGRFGKCFDSYIGNKPERRPERFRAMAARSEEFARQYLGQEIFDHVSRLGDCADQGLRDQLCLDPLKRLLNAWINEHYALAPSPAKAAGGRCPLRAFHELRPAGFAPTRPSEQDAALLLSHGAAITVRQNGIWVNAFSRHYWSDALEPRRCHDRLKVHVRFDPDDPSRVFVFDAAKDVFLAIATPYCGAGIHPLATSDQDQDRLQDAIALQRRLAADTRATLRGLHRHAAGILLEKMADGDRAAGLLDNPAALAPAAPPIIKLAGELSRAAQAAVRHDEQRRTKDAHRQRRRAADFLDATGTDDAAPRKPGRRVSALDLLSTPNGLTNPATDGSTGDADARGDH